VDKTTTWQKLVLTRIPSKMAFYSTIAKNFWAQRAKWYICGSG
jgi:hypothetical protein